MPETLAVHLNRDRLHAIEAPDSFETADSFVVEIENHGEAAHAHLRLGNGFAEIASLPSGNHYIRTGATARVPVSVHDTGPVRGTLTVATAYGSETHDIAVAVEPTAGKQTVEIDESLIQGSNRGSTTTRSSSTTSTTSTGSSSGRSGSRGSSSSRRSSSRQSSSRRSSSRSSVGGSPGLDTPALLGGTSLVILIGIGLLFLEGIAMFVGALAVLGGLVVAGYLLLY
ncbi:MULTISPECIES: DUF7524 family protein [Halococcus]|uniref:Uncharacterized protein n=1 Tax=Halococcus salifodinae DSM 8989 TaxID=1227456 RepID=M0MZ29_9EURY|nr:MULTISPECIES: hypothetical protein [Halococcus]EMA50866.1 hypothetical protein C450_14377 [Halococcus salifodinae DSM 8989]